MTGINAPIELEKVCMKLMKKFEGTGVDSIYLQARFEGGSTVQFYLSKYAYDKAQKK